MKKKHVITNPVAKFSRNKSGAGPHALKKAYDKKNKEYKEDYMTYEALEDRYAIYLACTEDEHPLTFDDWLNR